MTGVRIGTWNLDHARVRWRNEARLEIIRAADADLWVLTETSAAIDLSDTHQAITSWPRPDADPDETWVTIWSRGPVLGRIVVVDPERTAAALVETADGPLIVFGTVLPWHSDPGRGESRARNWSEHLRAIPEQAAEWAAIQSQHTGTPMCIAGDFNTTIETTGYYGHRDGRARLRAGLEGAGLACVSAESRVPEGLLRHPMIDHVCLSHGMARRCHVAHAWEGIDTKGRRLSDHSGVVVEVARKSGPPSW